MEQQRCKGYCGIACIDGTCPIANRDEYMERGYDVVWECSDCHMYHGCEDCYFAEGYHAHHLCDKVIKGESNE